MWLLYEHWLFGEFHHCVHRQPGSRWHDLLLRDHGGGSQWRERILEHCSSSDSCSLVVASGYCLGEHRYRRCEKFMLHPPDFDASRKERRHPRFDLQFPVLLSFPAGGAVRELAGVSRNISIGGVLLKVDDPVPVRTRVSLTLAVQDPRLRHPVRLLGKGKVVRVERLESGSGFAVAIQCKRPLTEIENLPAIC